MGLPIAAASGWLIRSAMANSSLAIQGYRPSGTSTMGEIFEGPLQTRPQRMVEAGVLETVQNWWDSSVCDSIRPTPQLGPTSCTRPVGRRLVADSTHISFSVIGLMLANSAGAEFAAKELF